MADVMLWTLVGISLLAKRGRLNVGIDTNKKDWIL